MVLDFKELQELSGAKQPTKVIGWLKVDRIPHVIGYDGKPRTTQQWLEAWQLEKWELRGNSSNEWLSEIRFKT